MLHQLCTHCVRTYCVQVVGLATCQPLLDLAPLQQNFLVSTIPGLEQQYAQGKQILQLQLFVLNPIFAHRAKQMLLEVLKLAKGIAAVYLLPSADQAPDVLQNFRLVAYLHPAEIQLVSCSCAVTEDCTLHDCALTRCP